VIVAEVLVQVFGVVAKLQVGEGLAVAELIVTAIVVAGVTYSKAPASHPAIGPALLGRELPSLSKHQPAGQVSATPLPMAGEVDDK